MERCNQEKQKGMCTLAGYNKATKTCYLSIDDPQAVLDTTDDMAGVLIFEPIFSGILILLNNKRLLFVNK